MRAPLVVLDADVLGRERTGDETYMENLLRQLSRLGDEAGLRFAAVTRHPEHVPQGIEPIALPARSQELRMAWSLPRLLHRIRPALAHFQHAVPLACPCPAVVTIHDLSFENGSARMPWKDRLVFRVAVRRSVGRATRVLAVSERTARDLVETYGLGRENIAVTPHGVDEAFLAPAGGNSRFPRDPLHWSAARTGRFPAYLLFVGAIQERKNPLAAADAATAVGLPLVVAGPVRDPRLARELERRGADVRGYVGKQELVELYRGAACLVLPSRFEGFGLPVLEAMASGTPVVAARDPALEEVAGDAAVYADPEALAAGIEHALRERERLSAAGRERARAFDWEESARRTIAVYREVLGGS